MFKNKYIKFSILYTYTYLVILILRKYAGTVEFQ